MNMKKAENSSTTQLGKHIPTDFSISTISTFKSIRISIKYVEVEIK